MGLDPLTVTGGALVLVGLVIIASLAGGIAARAFLDASRGEPRQSSPDDRPPRSG